MEDISHHFVAYCKPKVLLQPADVEMNVPFACFRNLNSTTKVAAMVAAMMGGMVDRL